MKLYLNWRAVVERSGAEMNKAQWKTLYGNQIREFADCW